MATRLPLVIGANGLVQQLQSGDQIVNATAQTDIRLLLNGESSLAIVIGAPVYISAAGTMKRAQANAAATSKVIGLGYDVSTAAAASGNAALNGLLVATTAQWDAVTGQTGGLTPGSTYFLDPTTVGKLTVTAPTTVGQSVVQVGVALSATDMNLTVTPPILL